MAKDNFEQRIRERYQGAEIQPSEGLWNGIEAAIANEEVSRYKRGMAYYRWIAAAGLLLILSYLGYRGFESQSGERIADQVTTELPDSESTTEQESVNTLSTDNPSNQDNSSSQELETLSKTDENSRQRATITGDPRIAEAAESPNISTALNKDNGFTNTQASSTQVSAIQRSTPVTSPLSSLDEDLLISELALLATPETVRGVVVYPVEKTSHRAILWAGLNMAPGSFDPNYTVQTNQFATPSNAYRGLSQASDSEDHRSGFSMALGVEMGMRLSERWQISSGVQYLNNNVQSSTNFVLDNRTPVFSSTVESLDLQADETGSNLSFEPTELDNTFQFVSIPVQAGYLVLDKNIKLTLSAGVASDVFLRNRISSVDNSLEAVTINPGSDAPFRSVYFNGLLGAQASYEFLPRYQLTLEPRYKLALSEFTKSNLAYSSLPSTFGIGFGVKYVFK